MAYTQVMALPGGGTAAAAAGKDVFGMRRCRSAPDVRDMRAAMRRSRSETHLMITCSVKEGKAEVKEKAKSAGIFPFSFVIPTLLPASVESEEVDEEMEVVGKKVNWVERLLELGVLWKGRRQRREEDDSVLEEEMLCEVSYEEEEAAAEFDRASFSRYLVPVSWARMRLFSRLAFLCNIAYVIPNINEEDLWEHHELVFVTSSVHKQEAAAAATVSALDLDSVRVPTLPTSGIAKQRRRAYEIAASAASFVQARAKELLSVAAKGEICAEEGLALSLPSRVFKSGMAAQVATTTMTAVVAAEEEAKMEAAMALRSPHSSPCEWFVCDDPSSFTRCFVIQGSDSLASWQANLFFEPTQFEGTEVLVHRGIYEAAKGIYEQFMPEIRDHLDKYGDEAKLRFTGHSLGGSLSLLICLMLLARKEIKPSTLLPVVTFGSPSVFCGGEEILRRLGMPEDHVYSVMMHRDIVPRAFSCDYPNRLAQVLKRLSGAFKSHPCLNKNKLLYAPTGQLYILQPDESASPSHPLLAPGAALYAMDKHKGEYPRGALRAFLNSPHPLETLSDLSAYGSEGTILRDHDSSNYLKAINSLVRGRAKRMRRPRSERVHHLWPLFPYTLVYEGRSLQNLANKETATEV